MWADIQNGDDIWFSFLARFWMDRVLFTIYSSLCSDFVVKNNFGFFASWLIIFEFPMSWLIRRLLSQQREPLGSRELPSLYIILHEQESLTILGDSGIRGGGQHYNCINVVRFFYRMEVASIT